MSPVGFALARLLQIAGAISRTIDTRIFSRPRDRFLFRFNELKLRNQSAKKCAIEFAYLAFQPLQKLNLSLYSISVRFKLARTNRFGARYTRMQKMEKPSEWIRKTVRYTFFDLKTVCTWNFLLDTNRMC